MRKRIVNAIKEIREKLSVDSIKLISEDLEEIDLASFDAQKRIVELSSKLESKDEDSSSEIYELENKVSSLEDKLDETIHPQTLQDELKLKILVRLYKNLNLEDLEYLEMVHRKACAISKTPYHID